MSAPESNAPHISQLRSELLATLRDLRNRETPMEPDRARAVAQVATVLVDSARVEVEYIKVTNAPGSAFIEQPADAPPQIEDGTDPGAPSAHNPFPSTVRHRLRG